MLRLEWREPEELDENPANWRTHPNNQLSALSDVIDQVGWAGACLYNETTGRLIDGHARKKVSQGLGKIPVLVGQWSEEQERLILATLDPLAALAGTDAQALTSLVDGIDPGSDAIADLLKGITDAAGVFEVDEAGMPALTDEPKTVEQMTFTLSIEQAETVRSALGASKSEGPFIETGNENANGNALARICEAFLTT